ncbi:MAG: hypothetical protein IKP43_02365 [Bacteroidaceae bacterium]|nr:hypothetical protein [Bacteroidaceae bacterium]
METTYNNKEQQDIPGGIGRSRRGRDGTTRHNMQWVLAAGVSQAGSLRTQQ